MKPTLTREQYKKIKNYNKDQMEQFLEGMVVRSYNRGVSILSSEVIGKIEFAIKSTKGIGEKRFEDIMHNILKVFNVEDGKNV